MTKSLVLVLLAAAPCIATAQSSTTRWPEQRSAIARAVGFLADGEPLGYLNEPSGADTFLRLDAGTTGLEVRSIPVATTGRVHDVTALPDLDGDGLAELALVETGVAGTGSNVLLLDGATGTRRGVEFLPELEPLGLLSLGRNEAGPWLGIVTADSSGSVRLRIHHARGLGFASESASASASAAIEYAGVNNPWAAVSLPTGPEERPADVAVLGVSDNSRVTVAVRNSRTGDVLSSLSFGAALVPVDVIALPDVFPDGSPELALLGEADEGRIVGVLIKEIDSGKTVARYRFSPNYLPTRLLHIPVPGSAGVLGVIGQRGNGNIALQRRDLDSGNALENVRFRAHYAPDDAALLKLPGQDSSKGVAIIGFDAFGHARLEVRDASTGAVLLNRDLRQADE